MDASIPMKQPLDHQLGLSIRANRPLWVILRDRDSFRISVSGARGGENDSVNVVLAHRIEQVQSVRDVVAEIEFGRLHRFADIGEGGEVNNGPDLILAKHAAESRSVSQVGL